MIRLEPVAAALLARILCIPHPTFMSHIGEDDERSTDNSRHRRNRGDKIKAIAAQSAAKDLEITRLRTVIRELEVENAVLKSHLAESRQTVHNLAGISSRAAPAEALSSPWSAHSPSSFSVATTTSQGFNVASTIATTGNQVSAFASDISHARTPAGAADLGSATRRRRRSDALHPDEARARRQARQNRRRRIARRDNRTAAEILAEDLADAHRSRALLRAQVARLRSFAARQSLLISQLRLRATLLDRLHADLDVALPAHLRSEESPDAPIQGAAGAAVPVHQAVQGR